MLPGLRILFVITLLSVSVLIFGLGAAAWLRSAHEDIASAPLRPIEAPVTARVDLAPATIALLRVEPEGAPAMPAPKLDMPAAVSVETMSATEAASTATAPSPPQAERAPALAAENTPQPAREIALQAPVPSGDAAPAVSETKVAEANSPETKAAETKEPPPAPTVVAALSVDKTEPAAANAAEPAPGRSENGVAPPANVATAPAAETPASETPAAIALGADTLKADDKTIDASPPATVAALTEPDLTAAAPLPSKDVRIPNPRVDPAVIEARRKHVIAQQRARARAALARRVAAARARAAAQAKAASDPFGIPANSVPKTN